MMYDLHLIIPATGKNWMNNLSLRLIHLWDIWEFPFRLCCARRDHVRSLSLSRSSAFMYTCCLRIREIHNERMIKERKQANWFAVWCRNQSTVYCTLHISSYVMLHRTMTCPIPLYSLLCIPILSWHITLYRIAIVGGWMLSESFKSWHLAPVYHSCSEYGRTSSLSYRSTRTIQHRILGSLSYLLLISERHNDKCHVTTESCINRIVLITKISYLLLIWHPNGIEK